MRNSSWSKSGQLSSDASSPSSLLGAIASLSVTFFPAGVAGCSADAAGGNPLAVCGTESKPYTSFSDVNECISIIGKKGPFQ